VDWSVSLLVAAPDAVAADEVEYAAELADQALEAHQVPDWVVSAGEADLSLTFTVAADTPVAAVVEGVQEWQACAEAAGVSDWPLVRCDAATYEVRLAEIEASALPALVGRTEVAQMLDAAESAVDESRLPEPIARLASGPVWLQAGIVKALAPDTRLVGGFLRRMQHMARRAPIVERLHIEH
jgi:hypothetical protein